MLDSNNSSNILPVKTQTNSLSNSKIKASDCIKLRLVRQKHGNTHVTVDGECELTSANVSFGVTGISDDPQAFTSKCVSPLVDGKLPG